MANRIHISNINNKTLAILDSIAKEKNISRSQLINEILEQYCMSQETKFQNEKYLKLIEINSKVINKNIEILNRLNNLMEEWNE